MPQLTWVYVLVVVLITQQLVASNISELSQLSSMIPSARVSNQLPSIDVQKINAKESDGCPDGFEHHGVYCFAWHRPSWGVIQPEAVQSCSALGATLAYPDTTDFVTWREAVIELITYDGVGTWVGATLRQDGVYTWLDNTPVPDAAWAERYPIWNETCVNTWNFSNEPGGLLGDFPCNSSSGRYFLCQVTAEATTATELPVTTTLTVPPVTTFTTETPTTPTVTAEATTATELPVTTTPTVPPVTTFTTETPTTPTGEELECYSCFQCPDVDSKTDIVNKEDERSCFTALYVNANTVIRGVSQELHMDGECQIEDNVAICYCNSDKCNGKHALKKLNKIFGY